MNIVIGLRQINRYSLYKVIALSYSMDIGGMRAKYKSKAETFTDKDLVCKEPFGQFKAWFDEACQVKEIQEANAMCLATATKDGIPSARYVLLKGFDNNGFKFFTNYTSRKGKELEENPRASLVFYWDVLKRSVRVEGVVEKLPEAESEAYFHSRPRESQLGAAVSNQSQPIECRDDLVTLQDHLRELYSDKIVSKPPQWGGYIVKPERVEFWQGQSDRLHDRIRFRRRANSDIADGVVLHEGDDGWVYERLAP